MKKLMITILACMPFAAIAQTDVEAAQKRLEEAQKALEAAKKAVQEAKKDSAKTANYNASKQNEKQQLNKQALTKEELTKRKAQAAAAIPEENPDAKYLAGAVPEVDGKIVFTKEIAFPGKTADEIYSILYTKLADLVTAETTMKGSAIVTADTEKDELAARIIDYLVFHSNALSLDRSIMDYVVYLRCFNGKATVEMSHIKYEYETDRKTGFKEPAERIISDKACLYKKGTKLNRLLAKFRRKTVDRFEELVETFK